MDIIKKILWIFIGILLISFIADPVLAPEESENNNIIYTTSTTTYAKEDGKKNIVIWGGIRNVKDLDSKFKPREKAKSFKKDSNINCVVNFDGYNIAKCPDYNETSRTIKFSITESRWDMFWESPTSATFETPIRKYHIELDESTKEFERIYDKEFETTIDFAWYNMEKEYILKANPNEIIEFGEYSTEIILNETNGGNLMDGYTANHTSNEDREIGDSTVLEIWGKSNRVQRGAIKYNISAIPPGQIIDTAYASFWVSTVNTSTNIEIYHVYDKAWISNTDQTPVYYPRLTHNSHPCGVDWTNSSGCNVSDYIDSVTMTNNGNVSVNRWYDFDVVNAIRRDYGDGYLNTSFALKQENESTVGDDDRYANLHSSETSNISQRPYLNITYSIIPNTASIVNNQFPANSTIQYFTSANFTYNVTDSGDIIVNCSLIINDARIETDSSITQIINQSINRTGLGIGQNLWRIDCYDDAHLQGSSKTFNLTIKTDSPIVRNQFPADHTSSSLSDVNFTYNVTTLTHSIISCDLFLNDVLNDTDNSITQDINQTFNKTLSDNYYDWLIQCESSEGYLTNSSAFNLTIDTTAPEINESVGLVDIIDTNYTINSQWYFNMSDLIIGGEICWYYTSDNSNLTTMTCNANTTINWTTEGLKSVYYCANDTLGNEDCRTNSLEVFYYNWTQTASKTTLGEGGSVTFDLVINMSDIESRFGNTYAYLNYNKTQYTPSSVHNAHNFTFSYTLAIPLGAGSQSGNSINWNWGYAIMNSTDFLINTTTTNQTQTVYSMGVGNCSFYNDTILNYTLRSEENRTILNGTIETNFIIRSFTDNTIRFNYSILNEGVRSIEICVSNETLSHQDYRLYVTTRYEADAHDIEYHYIENYNLSSESPIQYIDLHDLYSADSTSFLINYKDEFYLSVRGAIIDIHRFYVGDGIYRSVEMGKTDNAGQTRAHLVTEDVKYMFYVRVNGTLVYASPEYLALCQTAPCHIDLYEVTDTSSEYEQAGNIDYTFDLNTDTRSITFTFTTQDGTPSDINMNVTRMDAYSNHTACEESQTSSGGSLTCTVPTAYTNTTYIIEIYEDEDFITQRFFNLNPPAVDYFGSTGIFLAFIIIITLVFMAITSGIAMVVFAILGLILVGTINIIDVGNVLGVGSAIVWLSVAGVIIIYKLSQRRYH